MTLTGSLKFSKGVRPAPAARSTEYQRALEHTAFSLHFHNFRQGLPPAALYMETIVREGTCSRALRTGWHTWQLAPPAVGMHGPQVCPTGVVNDEPK